MKTRYVILLGLLLLCAGCQSNMQEKTMQTEDTPDGQSMGLGEVVGGDETALREFIQRYAIPYYGTAEDEGTMVIIGNLPETLPFELPLPGDARIIGTVVRGVPAGNIEILMDTDLSPEETSEFYADAFSGKDWQVYQEPGPGGGFTAFEYTGISFCYKGDQAYLTVNGIKRETGKTGLRLFIHSPAESYTICAQQGYTPGEFPPYDLIPQLVAPRGAFQREGGGGSHGAYDRYMTANLETDLGAADLLEHYNTQLEDAGWELVSIESTNGAAWSHWLMIDDDDREWIGILLVIEKEFKSKECFVYLGIEHQPE